MTVSRRRLEDGLSFVPWDIWCGCHIILLFCFFLSVCVQWMWNVLLCTYVSPDVKLKMGSERVRHGCWVYRQKWCACMGCIGVPHANVVAFWPCCRVDPDRPDAHSFFFHLLYRSEVRFQCDFCIALGKGVNQRRES